MKTHSLGEPLAWAPFPLTPGLHPQRMTELPTFMPSRCIALSVFCPSSLRHQECHEQLTFGSKLPSRFPHGTSCTQSVNTPDRMTEGLLVGKFTDAEQNAIVGSPFSFTHNIPRAELPARRKFTGSVFGVEEEKCFLNPLRFCIWSMQIKSTKGSVRGGGKKAKFYSHA